MVECQSFWGIINLSFKTYTNPIDTIGFFYGINLSIYDKKHPIQKRMKKFRYKYVTLEY